MGRLSDLRIVDPVLTSLARGYHNEGFIGDKLFPIVNVEKEGGKIPKFGIEAFRVYDTERAVRANSNEIDVADISTVDYLTDEHDLAYPIDYREQAESAFNEETRATETVARLLRLKHEKICADLAQATGSYASGNSETLDDEQFNDTDVDPIAVVGERNETLRGKIGVYGNALFMGGVVFEHLRNHAKLVARIQYAQVGVVTLDLMKHLFNVEHIFVGKSVYAADGSSTFTDIWGDNVIIAYLPNASGKADSPYHPSFGYTLRKKGNPFVDKYSSPGGKIKYVRQTDNYDVKIVGSDSAYLMKDVIG